MKGHDCHGEFIGFAGPDSTTPARPTRPGLLRRARMMCLDVAGLERQPTEKIAEAVMFAEAKRAKDNAEKFAERRGASGGTGNRAGKPAPPRGLSPAAVEAIRKATANRGKTIVLPVALFSEVRDFLRSPAGKPIARGLRFQSAPPKPARRPGVSPSLREAEAAGAVKLREQGGLSQEAAAAIRGAKENAVTVLPYSVFCETVAFLRDKGKGIAPHATFTYDKATVGKPGKAAGK